MKKAASAPLISRSGQKLEAPRSLEVRPATLGAVGDASPTSWTHLSGAYGRLQERGFTTVAPRLCLDFLEYDTSDAAWTAYIMIYWQPTEPTSFNRPSYIHTTLSRFRPKDPRQMRKDMVEARYAGSIAPVVIPLWGLMQRHWMKDPALCSVLVGPPIQGGERPSVLHVPLAPCPWKSVPSFGLHPGIVEELTSLRTVFSHLWKLEFGAESRQLEDPPLVVGWW